MQPLLLLGFIIALLVTLFAYQNPEVVSIKFIKWHTEGSVAFICLALFGFGFLTSFLFMAANLIKHKWKLRGYKKRIEDLEDELADREKRPIVDLHRGIK